MSYPSLEQYQEALQNPSTALLDPELKRGSILTTGLGLPLVLCGGFALTYTITSGGKRLAVRCFHKKAERIEQRYRAITSRLRVLKSNYFVDFEYQPQGVRVNGQVYPVVKMAWASGETLGDFLQRRYVDKSALGRLRRALWELSVFLDNSQLAHGDIQPDNLMVSNDGSTLRLIDYDGMFVPELAQFGSSELGHRNFQHPKRSSIHYDRTLDRFSFIILDIALRALESHPRLWDATSSDADSVLFRANDYSAPSNSTIFAELSSRCGYSTEAARLAAVCQSAFDGIPSFPDFVAGRGIPQIAFIISQRPPTERVSYSSAYPVLDASQYALCLARVGDRVELIGRIFEVKSDRTRGGKPYVFLNFGPWQGEAVKISLWSEGLSSLSARPDQTWVGKWVSVVGLMEPPYRSRKYKYSHLAVTITQANQLRILSEGDAKYRLNTHGSVPQASRNTKVLEAIVARPGSPATHPKTGSPKTHNQQLLDAIKSRSSAPTSGRTSVPPASTRPQKSKGWLRSILDFLSRL